MSGVECRAGACHPREREGERARRQEMSDVADTPRHLAVSIFIAFCCACANGYDGSLMTAILAMPHFQDTFNSGTTGIQVSVIFSLYTVYVDDRSSPSW